MPPYLLIYDIVICFKRKNKVHSAEQNYDSDYDELRTRFMNEYDRANPITKDLAFKEYMLFLKSSAI